MPPDHPLRLIRAVVNEALDLAPEKLLRALYCIRSKRQLMEQRDRNLLFRWFVGLSRDGSVWNAGMFSKNRDRLLDGDVAQRLLAAVVAQPRIKLLMSPEHFSVDSTLIRAWATHKSLQTVFDTEPPAGDGPGAQVGRASQIHASGTAERNGAPSLVGRMAPGRRITLAVDKGYEWQASSRPCRPAGSHGISRSTGRVSKLASGAARLGTDARWAMRAMPPASACAEGSRWCSAGSRDLPICGSPGIAAVDGLAGN